MKKIKSNKLSLYGRIAAIFTFKQLFGNDANQKLGALLKDRTIKAFLLKAITDRKTQLKNIDHQWYALALFDKDERVRLEAINGLVRLQNSYYNEEILNVAKNFKLPYLVDSKLKPINYKDNISVKTYAKRINIPVKGRKKVYLSAVRTAPSKYSFVWANPKFITKDGTSIKINKQLITNIEGEYQQDNLPIYFNKKPIQAEYGFSTNKTSFPQSLLIELEVPDEAIEFEVISAPKYVWSEEYGFDISITSNKPNLKQHQYKNTVIQHIAIQGLGRLKKSYLTALKLLNEPKLKDAAMTTLFLAPHSLEVIQSIKEKLDTTSDEDLKGVLIQVLARLYHKEKPWSLDNWWGTKPDHRGPYFVPITWSGSPYIKKIIEEQFKHIKNKNLLSSLLARLRANRINPLDFKLGIEENEFVIINNKKQINAEDIDIILKEMKKYINKLQVFSAYNLLERAQGVSKEILFNTRIELLNLMKKYHLDKKEMELKLQNFVYSVPHLSKEVLLQKATKSLKRNKVLIQDNYLWKHIIYLSTSPLVPQDIRQYLSDHIKYLISPKNASSKVFALLLEAIQFIKTNEFLPQLEMIVGKAGKNNKMVQKLVKKMEKKPQQNVELNKLVGLSKTDDIMKWINKVKGNKIKGKAYSLSTGCIACHTFSPLEQPKGPYLGSVGAKFSKKYIIESIVEPTKQVSQGFSTKQVTLKNGQVYVGFNTKTTADFLEIRTIVGQTTRIAIKDIKGGLKGGVKEISGSQMPAGLVSGLTRQQFADFIAYLQSLKSH